MPEGVGGLGAVRTGSPKVDGGTGTLTSIGETVGRGLRRGSCGAAEDVVAGVVVEGIAGVADFALRRPSSVPLRSRSFVSQPS